MAGKEEEEAKEVTKVRRLKRDEERESKGEEDFERVIKEREEIRSDAAEYASELLEVFNL
jgi:hypothetical protein